MIQPAQKLASLQAMPEENKSELERLLQSLNWNNERYASSILLLEKIGHKLQNTNVSFDEAKEGKDGNHEIGLIADLNREVSNFSNFNTQFSFLIEKIQKLV